MIFKLVDAIFVMPVQTAPVKRGLSMHRIVKNCLTSRLIITTIHSLLCSCKLWGGLDSIDKEFAVPVHRSTCREKG